MKHSIFVLFPFLLFIASCGSSNDREEIERIKNEAGNIKESLALYYIDEDTSNYVSELERNKYSLLIELLNTKDVEDSRINIEDWKQMLYGGLVEFSEAGYTSAKQAGGSSNSRKNCINVIKEEYRNCLSGCKGNYDCGTKCTQVLFDDFDSCKNKFPIMH